MPRKTQRNTRGKIVAAAWKLFYEQGYEHTTVEDILALSGTSKGTFYHYFEGKDALLGTLSVLFDEKYAALMPTIPEDMDALDTLAYLNREQYGETPVLFGRTYNSERKKELTPQEIKEIKRKAEKVYVRDESAHRYIVTQEKLKTIYEPGHEVFMPRMYDRDHKREYVSWLAAGDDKLEKRLLNSKAIPS